MGSDREKTEVRLLTKRDVSVFAALIEMFRMAFEEPESRTGSETNLQRLLDSEHFIAIAAVLENEIVGGLTAYILPMYYSDDYEVFLYDMAVKPNYQRMGIGKKLIHSLKEYCIKKGVKVFFVLAHEEDEHAVEFYRSTGGISEKVVNFVYETEDIHK